MTMSQPPDTMDAIGEILRQSQHLMRRSIHMETDGEKLDSWDPRQKGYQRSNASEQMEGREVTPSAADLI